MNYSKVYESAFCCSPDFVSLSGNRSILSSFSHISVSDDSLPSDDEDQDSTSSMFVLSDFFKILSHLSLLVPNHSKYRTVCSGVRIRSKALSLLCETVCD
mmetsp:Transcript_14871/g.19526  ORF Transcript_14871/g.19526 Transcript_14871/m.19526 type:complete len:100 (-) Transcript_14871:125-424(-)